jgi:long-chain fatty acid transport protein
MGRVVNPTRRNALWGACILAVSATAASLPAHATNGMYMIGFGAKATGMGGAGVAYPQDAMAPAYNPAGMTEVGQMRFDATLELFYPPRAVMHDSTTIPADVKSKDNLFPIPALGAVMSDPSTPLAMGMAIVGAGLGTNYAQSDGTFFDPAGSNVAYNRVGVFLMQMQMLPSFAYRVNDNHSIGASVVIAMQTFTAFGLESFTSGTFNFTTDTSKLTNNGHDWGFGFGYRLGWLGKYFDKRLNVGLAYNPRVEMQKFNRYTGLFANHGEFDIPTNYALGLAYKLTPKSNVAFDVQRIRWSEVRSIGNQGPTTTGTLGLNPLCPSGNAASVECQLGGDLGMGFGWTDQTVYKLGMDYKWSPTLTVRGGLNYGKAPIPEDQVMFNMLAPATTEEHITFGFTQMLDKDSDFTFTFMHAFENVIKGPTMFPGASASLAMQQTSLSFAYGLRF